MNINVSIVVIDDNAASLELLSESLAQRGATIFSAQDPDEGIETV